MTTKSLPKRRPEAKTQNLVLGTGRKPSAAVVWGQSIEGATIVNAAMAERIKTGEAIDDSRYPLGALKSVRIAEFAKLEPEERAEWQVKAQAVTQPPTDPAGRSVLFSLGACFHRLMGYIQSEIRMGCDSNRLSPVGALCQSHWMETPATCRRPDSIWPAVHVA